MLAEMFDGVVVLSPAPGFAHQDAVLSLAITMRAACPPGLRVLVAPFGVRLGERAEVRPDVLVARYVDLTSDGLAVPPLLAVEVRSPGTALIDQSVKKALYAQHRVQSYWIVDPEAPSLTAYELAEPGGYLAAGHASGAETWQATRPFPVTVRPIDLVAGLRP
ncbi:MAG TPA: Uma2 family endonuclease [Mycobacteriales bacterium]|nr:Uma2 family endonuclease [Mycobacteriales bacterium]